MDVLEKLSRINKNFKCIILVANAQRNTIDGFRKQSLYQGFAARIRNSRKNTRLDKIVDVVQAEIQRTREAIEAAGEEVLSRVRSGEDSNSHKQSARRVKFGSNSNTHKNSRYFYKQKLVYFYKAFNVEITMICFFLISKISPRYFQKSLNVTFIFGEIMLVKNRSFIYLRKCPRENLTQKNSSEKLSTCRIFKLFYSSDFRRK